MTGLVPEIAKIGAYAKGRAITQKDIDAVADPVLSAEVFRLSEAARTASGLQALREGPAGSSVRARPGGEGAGAAHG